MRQDLMELVPSSCEGAGSWAITPCARSSCPISISFGVAVALRAAQSLEIHMSHIVTVRTQVRDPAAVAAACHRLGLPPPQHRTVKLFSDTAEGLAVELP